MATWTEKCDLTRSDIDNAIREMERFINKQDNEAFFVDVTTFVFTDLLMIVCAYGALALRACAQLYNLSVTQIISNAKTFLSRLREYKAILDRSPEHNKIRVNITFERWHCQNVGYDIPIKSEIIMILY
ncbi:hypothetical protein [Desulfotomaculum sp. 1211_IL3151]|uniref:hypothetical protein n=1 Tax=Desulfotomaculum sp. 1211_IL3151 TaxID=3084055 RepID=UPI002FDB0610